VSKILVFSPFEVLWSHSYPESLVIEALQKAGHEILKIKCEKDFATFCVGMAAFGKSISSSDEEKEAICRKCMARGFLLNSRLKIQSEQLFAGKDFEEVWEKFYKSNKTKMSSNKLKSISFRGYPIGKFIISSFFIKNKKSNFDFTTLQLKELVIEAKNTLKSLLSAEEAFRNYRPDRFICTASNYSVNFAWCAVAERNNVPFYYLMCGTNLSDRYQKLVLCRGYSLQRDLLKAWPRFKNRIISKKEIEYINKNINILINSKSVFVYSKTTDGADIVKLQNLGIQNYKKVYLATTSSYDEIYAAQESGLYSKPKGLIFNTQIDWLEFLISEFKKQPDYLLIIRVHPREFPNKRDSETSDHAQSILNLKKRALKYSNIYFNLPDDNISLYSIFKFVDIGLNGWSTVGKEMGLFGIPVISYCKDLLYYPQELNIVPDGIEKYKKALFAEIGWQKKIGLFKSTYRWQIFEDLISKIDISDSFSHNENTELPRLQKIRNQLFKKIDPLFVEKSDIRNRSKEMKSGVLITKIIELKLRNKVEYLMKISDDVNYLKVRSDEEEGNIIENIQRLNHEFLRKQSKAFVFSCN